MYPPVYLVCATQPEVQALLGDSPTRLYPFGEAPQPTPAPYVIWQTLSGQPENFLGDLPDIDRWSIQIDCYAETAEQVRDIGRVMRDAIEPHAHVMQWRGEYIENATNLYRISFDVDWWVNRI